MTSYAVLLRGINVGGRNKVPMAALRDLLTDDLGFEGVRTYIQSGNVVLRSRLAARTIAGRIETALPTAFALDSEIVRALVLSHDDYRAVVEGAPDGFGADEEHRWNVVFLIGVTAEEVFDQFEAHPEVDRMAPGPGVVYFSNTKAGATRSRLNRITAQPVYKSTTVRNWNTTRRILALLDEAAA